jgi:hypothetical protein
VDKIHRCNEDEKVEVTGDTKEGISLSELTQVCGQCIEILEEKLFTIRKSMERQTATYLQGSVNVTIFNRERGDAFLQSECGLWFFGSRDSDINEQVLNR